MPDKEIEMVYGTVDSIITKGPEKWQAVVKERPDQQYGKKLWTKDKAVFDTVTSLIGQVATFECGVSHYNLPDGTPTHSLWINAVNPGTPPPTEPPGAEEALQGVAQEATGASVSAPEPSGAVPPTPQPQSAPRASFSEWDRQASIETQSALKCAVEYAVLDPAVQTVDGVLKVAAAFNAFLATKGVPF